MCQARAGVARRASARARGASRRAGAGRIQAWLTRSCACRQRKSEPAAPRAGGTQPSAGAGAERPDGGGVVVGLEDRRARDEHVGAGGGRLGAVGRFDAPVDLDEEAAAVALAKLAGPGELLE